MSMEMQFDAKRSKVELQMSSRLHVVNTSACETRCCNCTGAERPQISCIPSCYKHTQTLNMTVSVYV